jgi:competence protein ComEC
MRLVYIAFGWVAGILLAANNPRPTLVWLALIALAGLATWLAWPNRQQRLMMIALVAFTLGGLRMTGVPTTSPLAEFNNTGGLTIEGVVAAEPDIRDTNSHLRVAVDAVQRAGQRVPTEGLALVRAPRSVAVQVGDRVVATGLLIAPAEFDTFSYADYLGRFGVFSIMQEASVEVLSPAEPSILSGLSAFKARSAQHIARALPEPQAALLTGILLGNESGIAPEIEEAFSRAGAAHVIAISGFNMAILAGVILALLRPTPLSVRISALVAILIIGLYTLLVGANAAVVRAAIMSSLLVIGEAIRRQTYVPASLALVAILMSLLNPTVLWDVSFQLSFFATLGLALYVQPLQNPIRRVLSRWLPRGFTSFIAEPLIVTLAVQITTLPLIILYFNRLSLVVVLTNLLIVPVQAMLLILGLLATLLAFVAPPLAQILYWYDLVFLSWTIEIVRHLANLPFADVVFHVDPRLIVLYYVILLGVALMQATQPAWVRHVGRLIRHRAITYATLLSGTATVLLIGATFFSRPDSRLHLWLLDVGHSHAVLLQTPGGAQMLVDGGRFPSRLLTALGDRLPFYDRTIEVLALTQPDPNEYSALPAVLNRYDVGVVLTNGQPNLNNEYANLQAQFAAHSVVQVQAGYTLAFDDGVQLEVLHPQSPPDISNSLNAVGLVLRVTFGETSFLITGDISPVAQQELLVNGRWPLANVLVLPQHGGARTLDSAFLEAVQPQVVLVQADAANRIGDPDPDTLLLVGDRPVYRTDTQGALHLWTDGTQLWVQPARR